VGINGIIGAETAPVVKRVGEKGNMEAVQKGLDANCSSCHVSGCGDCHVSRPQSSGSGFVDGHVFQAKPISTLNCMACHGSRVQKEYTGSGESTKTELVADLHWTAGMQCTDCHTESWIHGGQQYTERYKAPAAPSCEYCHNVSPTFLASDMHRSHAAHDAKVKLQCQVCHSQDTNNCTGCHVGVDDKGLASFTTKSSYFDFKIGRNYDRSDRRPWDFTVVRQIPIDPDTFDYYGDNALADFAAVPTYKYATPHNIARVTPRTKDGCDGCHKNDAWFLTADDIASMSDAERSANASVVVER
jgi:thiosulfate/3-mercaptopyruvate sulfurtransferase